MDSQLLYFWGNWGEAELILAICGAKANYFQGAEDFFQEFGEINALFLGNKGTQTPSPGGTSLIIKFPFSYDNKCAGTL